jgi:capsular exopolysaccharide synthesis family protein
MSRFYSTLKEASRTQPPPPPPPDHSLNPAEAMGIDFPAVLPVSAPEVRDTLTPEPTNGLVGTFVNASIDSKAPLIPHSVDTGIVEHYRRLRTKILHKQQENPFKTLVIVSPNPQEGKTVTVLNLGLSLAMLPDYRVLVVDGDLRRGMFDTVMNVSPRAGFSNYLEGTASLKEVVLRSENVPMAFMLRGDSKIPPADLFHSPYLERRLKALGEHFDIVLFDSAPVNLLSDSQTLAGNCDAVLLVARAFSTPRTAIQKALKELAHTRIIGTVLNAVSTERRRKYQKYY